MRLWSKLIKRHWTGRIRSLKLLYAFFIHRGWGTMSVWPRSFALLVTQNIFGETKDPKHPLHYILARSSKRKKYKNQKLHRRSQGTSKRIECQFSVENVTDKDHWTPKKNTKIDVMFTYWRPTKRSLVRRRLQTAYAIVRPNLLSALRRSATRRTAAYHVGSWRRHIFLFKTLMHIRKTYHIQITNI